MKYTRQQYMNDKECSHAEYYGQFINYNIINAVKLCIGEDKIKKSKDPHFNDIPLNQWDNMKQTIISLCGRSIAEANGTGGISLSDTVCVAKQAAHQIRGK